MHRSRLPVLMIFAAIAACSSRDASEGTDILSTEMLSQDTTLVARLATDEGASPLPLPSVCGVVTIASQPAVSNQAQAKELTVQAQNAEMHGDIAEARSLLGRALALDGTSKSAAYHLGRTSEALGDRVAATSAYCRYLALTPTTAESAEARQRVATLTRGETRTSAGSIGETTPVVRRTSPATKTRRQSRQRTAFAPRKLANAPVEQSGAATAPERAESTTSPVGGGSENETVVASPRPAPDQPATASPSTGPSRAQSGIMGAAAGAIVGAATGRSVKGAAIGAAAGGILGTMMGRGSRPVVRGIRS